MAFDRKTPPDWVWAYHVTPAQFLPSIVERGLQPNRHPHVEDVPVLFVEPDLAGVEPYWGPGMALLRFKVPGFGATEDGESVLFGGDGKGSVPPPFEGAPGEAGAIPPEKLQVLEGKRFRWLLP